MEPGLKDWSPLARAAPRTADWIVEAAQAFCQCIWDTCGRFPATVDPMSTLLRLQALHLATGFHDEFHQRGAYAQAIRNHAKNWHGGE